VPRRHVYGGDFHGEGETVPGGKGILRRLYRRSRADRWSSLFGQVAVYSFVVTAPAGSAGPAG